MNRTLYKKFILAYVIFGIAGFVFLSTVGSRVIEQYLIESCSSSLTREARSIASRQASLYYKEERTLQSLYNTLSALSSFHDAQIWLISPDGEILLNTEEPLDTETYKTIQGFDPVELGSNYYSTGDFFGQFDTEMLTVMVPVTSNYSINGYVAIHRPLTDLYHERESLLLRVDLMFLVIFLLSFGILALFAFTVYRPLQKIIQGADEYAEGNLTYQIQVDSQDELGYLARTLNYMSGELNKIGEYQKKFVANVSHDFRSPLTSIKGYVEAIADGTIPPEMQDRYLNIVLFETERLNKLTQSLLTLNDIDSKGNMLEITKFDINAVIKNTAAAFEGICTSRKITISLVIPSSGTSFEIGATAIFKGAKHPNAAKLWIEFALSPDCVNIAKENESFQFLVIDNAEQPEEATAFGLDPENVIDYDFEEAKNNTSKYVEDYFNALGAAADGRFQTE